VDIRQRMREEWNRRAREDAFFYAGFGRRRQQPEEFLTSAADTVAKLESELVRLPGGPVEARRSLEIGCGPGRLMLPMSRHFGEIHGVDVSEEMVALARENLKPVSHAQVHATSGADLSLFPDDFFDFVYSYIVFQHIPDREIILNYLRESKRVLKTAGVLCAQLRGAPPLPSELERESATWTGSYFTAEEVRAFSREQKFHLVVLEGTETQYQWTTWVKPPREVSDDFSRFALKAVTAASGGHSVVPARGRDAAVSLWLEGLPPGGHLGNLDIHFHDAAAPGCYLSPLSPTGACQLNARLPRGLAPGRYSVGLAWEGRFLGAFAGLEVTAPPPRRPRILAISDGINIASKNRVETGGMKVTIEDIERPEEVAFTVAGLPAQYLQYERKDPITDTYEFAFHLPENTPRGKQPLRISVSGRDLPPEPIEIVWRPRGSSVPRQVWRRLLSRWRRDSRSGPKP